MTFRLTAVSITIAGFGLFSVVGRAATDPYNAWQQRALSELQPKVDQIVSVHGNEPTLTAFLGRLELLDQAGRAAARAIDGNRGQALDDLLGSSGGKSASVSQTATTLEDMVALYGPKFNAPLGAPEISEEERHILREYFNTKIRAGSSYLAVHAAKVVEVAPGRADLVDGLALLPIWLTISDDSWSFDSADLMPSALLAPTALAACEREALSMERPRTAFYLAARQSGLKANTLDAPALISYVNKAASVLTRNKHYPQAEACLKAGIAAATVPLEAADETRLSLAQLQSDTNRPKDAAETLESLVTRQDASPLFGRSCMFRLKYLFQAGEHKQIIEEYRKYMDDQRTKEYQPQILYLGWCAAQELQTDMESRLRKEFLDKFPTHSLGANLYFSAAMQALANSDYAEARRILAYIEYRYPTSQLMPKVKSIESKLAEPKANDTPGH